MKEYGVKLEEDDILTISELEKRWYDKFWLTTRLDRDGIIDLVESGSIPAYLRMQAQKANGEVITTIDSYESDPPKKIPLNEIEYLIFDVDDILDFEDFGNFGSGESVSFFGTEQELVHKLPILMVKNRDIAEEPDPRIAELEQQINELKAERSGKGMVSVKKHGLIACIINMRRAGKTDKEIAKLLSKDGQRCSKGQLGALLYHGNNLEDVQSGSLSKFAERLLKVEKRLK